MVKKFWLDMGLNMHHIANTQLHWLQNLHDLDISLNNNNNLTWKDFYPFALWHIWLQRNQKVFAKDPIITPSALLQLIMMHAFEFKLLNTSHVHNSLKKEILIYWSSSTINYYKLTTDGVFIKKDQTKGLGRVVRDPNGNCVNDFYKKKCFYPYFGGISGPSTWFTAGPRQRNDTN